ncbi:phage terminase large subunit [Phocaeicola coprocola]|uniref:phage terminase large subunit n=1 Tax=Phocaeicola coprocola TaxID=310298 RepID=UPI002431640B|nr:phage terminase large subunit [Phocaeicola coprocola]
MTLGLKAPRNLRIDFMPSPKQYELWKLLQPDYCPHCGGHISQKLVGHDIKGNPQYKPYCTQCGSTDLPQLILGGGAAGGGKSYLGSCWLVSSCMRFSDIRAVVARKTLKSLKGSTWNTIKKVCKEWGLKEGVHYKINNLDGILTFWNDSVIIMQEMVDLPSDPNFERFGSSEFTIAFIDEVSEISERAVEVLFSRLRWRTAETFKTARMMMSTNPCITWVRSRFVQDDEGNPITCREGEAYVPFSVFDNPDVQFVQTYVAALNKITDKATRERLLYGNWDFVDSNIMAAYWNFDGQTHLIEKLSEKVYDPMKPIISGWDFNVAPYMSELEFQFNYDKKEIYIIEENLGKPENKENNTPALAKKIKDKKISHNHIGGIVITGDPAGAARSTQTEDGVNNYTIIEQNMKNGVLRPRIKLLSKQPPLVTRLEFVNAIFSGYDGWKVMIDLRCRKLTEDLIYQTKNADGTKCKKKVTNAKTGGKEEKYGHLSDILDYVFVQFLSDSWRRFQNQKTSIETYTSEVYSIFNF